MNKRKNVLSKKGKIVLGELLSMARAKEEYFAFVDKYSQLLLSSISQADAQKLVKILRDKYSIRIRG